MNRLRTVLVLAAVLVGILVVAAILGRGGNSNSAATPVAKSTASATAGASVQAAGQPTPSRTPIVVPTNAIPLPQCPPAIVPEVDNPARYGFCVPPGWGAYNENNTLQVTQILKPVPGDPNPVLLPTDFSRIQVVIALDVAAPSNPPADCIGAPNDTIAGFPAHHCVASLDPSTNPYHANEAQYWRIELPQNRSFYITSLSNNATQSDLDVITGIVHLVRPLG